MNDNQVIPEAAVEAAAWVVITGQKHGHEAVTIARAALEAAAPHMTIDPHDGFVAWFRSAGNGPTT